ncbi:MAG: acyl-CoA dehydrogenase [Alphaproteobacteria bacterium]
MDLRLSKREREIQARARAFVETFLFPAEWECEQNQGLTPPTYARIKRAVVEHGLNAINHKKKNGGQGFTLMEQTLAWEEMGKATCGLWTLAWLPPKPLELGTPEQIRAYLRPSCAGRRRAAFAVTEPGAGSDPSRVKTTARRKQGRYVISGEKWFVTSGDVADYLIVHAHVDGDKKKPTLFLIDKATPGVRVKRTPRFMHTYVHEHPEFVLRNAEVSAESILGEVGQGFELTKDWFVEARLEIAAHCIGAATRAAEIANAYAAERVQFGRRLRDFQGIEFQIADMAVEIMALKSMVYRVAWEIDQGLDRKLIHARAAAIKLYGSEVAGRVVDRALQILGGRGYMRENPVERLYRDVRVDRIWEGASEIQRMVIGGQIRKRGLGVYTGWA